jgi:hypothetical protein
MERWGASPLRPTYIGEKGSTLGKTYGIQVRCCWEHLWGTHWEPHGNLKGTCWEQWKNEKKSLLEKYDFNLYEGFPMEKKRPKYARF